MKKAVIELSDFSFQYESQQQPTLKQINLTIYEGEKVLILGASGSGKSTLGYCLNGIIPNRYKGKISGKAMIAGQSLQTASIFSLAKQVGTLLQDSDAQFVGLSVSEDIAFALENKQIKPEEMEALVCQAADRVGVTHQLSLLPYALSGGQKQRVTLAGILHEEIDIILLDEPLAALDPHMSEKMIEVIDSLNKMEKKTVVIIEHRLEEVLHKQIDRIILMDKGCIVADTTPDALLSSTLLKRFGIREPLYISAINNMLGGLQQSINLASLSTIDLEPYKKVPIQYKPLSLRFQEAKEIIQLNQVAFGYDSDAFIQVEKLVIKQGERIALIGENGSGKTTLAKLLTGVLACQSGEIKREGNPETIQEIAQTIGYVMQQPNQMLVSDTVFNEVALALKLRGFSEQAIKESVLEVLKVTGLYEKRNWPIAALSYGQKKRLSVAVVLVLEPKCLILDEPTAGQDYAHYKELMTFIDKLNKEKQITVIFITHDLHLALEYTDRGIVMQNGRIIDDRPIFDILDDDTLIQRASLRKTSIFQLAKQLGQPVEPFVETFIQTEKGETV